MTKDKAEMVACERAEMKELKMHSMISLRVKDSMIASVPEVLSCLSKAFGVPVEFILSKTRKREAVWARQIGSVYTMSNADPLIWSLEKIGAEYGGRNHATVLNDHRKFMELRDDVLYKMYINRFIKHIYDINFIYATKMNAQDRMDIKKGLQNKKKGKKNE